MKQLFTYFKPYLILLSAAIVLLFIQAYTNLALPDYMSDIVNTGIQQGGITNAVPSAVRKETLDKLLTFTSKDDTLFVLQNYTLMKHGTDKAAAYQTLYPRLEQEDLYILNSSDSKTIERLNVILTKPWLITATIENPQFNPADGMPDFSGLPKDTDPFTSIKALPEPDKKQIISMLKSKFDIMIPKMAEKAAASLVRLEYSAIGMDTGSIQIRYMFHIGTLMLLYTLIGAAAAIITGFLSAKIAAGFARDIRYGIFEKIEHFNAQEFDTFSTASLITRSTNDIMQIQMITVMLVSMAFYAPIIGIGGIIRAIGKSSSMWWIIALAVAVLLIIIATVFNIAVPKFKLLQRLMDKLNLVSRESLSGMLVIRAFNMQTHEEKRFDEVNKDLTGTMLFVNRVMVVMMPVMLLIMNGLSILIIWVGAKQVAASTMQIGDMMAFMQYAMQIVFAFLMLSMMFIMIPRAAVSAGRVAEVLGTEPVIKDPSGPVSFKEPFDGTVVFENVSFRYPGAKEDALHNISFTAKKGQTTAFIGPTGSGKSTLVNLIPRFYDVTRGNVYVGGEDVRTVTQQDLRGKIGYIPQKSVLFSGTVEDNLRYGDKNADSGTVQSALSVSQAEEFIETLPKGIKSDISQGGANVSGGQKQRISIARALVKKAPIYIFDDSFSALDFKTDAKLRKALAMNSKESTILLVAQRVSTIKNADQIIVLEEGKIAGMGTHKELMESSKVYREIATSQLSREELA